MKVLTEKDFTKISIAKNLHDIVKKICDERGIKMYHFENMAVEKYIQSCFPEYLNGKKNKE